MGTLLLDQIKKQASSFLQDKYKIARLALTDVTEAELLAEEVTNDDLCSPDARTMTKIAVATFGVGDYWRIVDVLHSKFGNEEWKMKWRQSYKALVLLEFLLTHGPEGLADEFLCDLDSIRELSAFHYVDDKGFDWGNHMQKRADNVENLLLGREELEQARLKALKLTREIKGFGNTNTHLISSPSPPPSKSKISPPFDSLYAGEDSYKQSESPIRGRRRHPARGFESVMMEDHDDDDEDDDKGYREGGAKDTLIDVICSKLSGYSPLKKFNGGPATEGFRSFSNTEKVSRKTYYRQHSIGY